MKTKLVRSTTENFTVHAGIQQGNKEQTALSDGLSFSYEEDESDINSTTNNRLRFSFHCLMSLPCCTYVYSTV